MASVQYTSRADMLSVPIWLNGKDVVDIEVVEDLEDVKDIEELEEVKIIAGR